MKLHAYGTRSQMYMYMIQTNADFIFQKLIVLFLVDFKLRKAKQLPLVISRIDICPSCFVYDLSNTIFCPIGSALMKPPVASQIWTHNSKRLAYMLTA